ncbi:MAG: polysaccharide pyruvyl transferase CsaB [Ruminococcaceae bacterium]|nr:polysaccharide pyruvyl transferase CsaB [Oscillospiraceae bacterium]
MDITPKKILMTLMRLEIGGAETHVLELSLELKRQGYDVVVASGGGVYEKPLQKAGIKHYRVPMYTKSPDKVIQSLCALRKIIRDEKVDIVHAHGRIPAFLCGLLHPFMRFTFVTTAHWVFRTNHGFKYLSNWGQKVMSVSEDIKTYLMDNYGTDPQDIYVTINGIDTNKFHPDADCKDVMKEFSLSEESQKIVYISRMDEDRALVAFHLAEIAPEIDRAFPGTEIVIVGGGNVYDKLEALTEKINAQIGRRMVVLTGGRTDIDKFAALSDIFIGVSRSALEAMSCAKPVIVAGNEGYLGIFDEDKLAVGIDTNFCCRGLAASTPELLLADVKRVMGAGEAEKKHWGDYARQTICDYYSVSKMAADNAKMYQDAVSERPIDAVISGYYGYENSGDEALLSAMLTHLKEEKPDVRLCVLSKDPKKTYETHGVPSINRYNYCAMTKAIKQAKLFISGGGSLLQDVTSSRSLGYYLLLIKKAQKHGTPVMLYANGIGPITKSKNRKAVAKVLSMVSCITLRDAASKEEIDRLGVSCDATHVTADPALTIDVEKTEAVDALMKTWGVGETDKLFGISVRPWKTCGQEFLERLAAAIDAVSQKRGLTPVFVPMKYPEDYELSCAVSSRLTVPNHVVLAQLGAAETVDLISRMELILAERLHSLIYAANALVPIIGLSYDVKVDAFMEYLGAGERISLEELSVESLEQVFETIYESRESICAHMREKHDSLAKLARDNASIAVKLIEQ